MHFQLVFFQLDLLVLGLESSDAHVSVPDQVLQPDNVFDALQKLAVVQCELRFPHPLLLRRLALPLAVGAHVCSRVHAKNISIEGG